jgi:thiol-disulfide isomerase/thioredoxin
MSKVKITLMTKKRLLYFISGMAIVLLCIVLVLIRQYTAPETEYAAQKGAYAPQFTGVLLDGGNFDLAQLRGQWLILNFWATWCVPCRQEMPELQALYEDTGIMVVGVNLAEGADTVAAWLSDYQISYPIVLDPAAEIFDLYRIMGQPTTFVINPDGLIVEMILGATNAESLREIIENRQDS